MHSESFNIEISEIDNLLEAGIAAAKAGHLKRARNLLKQTIQQDSANIKAWVWLSSVVEDPAQQAHCLQKILAIDPTHKVAQNGLQALQKKKAEPDQIAQPTLKPLSPRPHTNAGPDPIEKDTTTAPAGQARIKKLPQKVEKTTSAAPSTTLHQPTQLKRITPPPPSNSLETIEELFENEQAPAVRQTDTPPKPRTSTKNSRRQNLNIFDNELLCPYCAHPTQPDDEACLACQQSLWQKDLRQKKPSKFYRFLMWSHIISNIINLSAILLILQAAIKIQFITPLQAIASSMLCIPSVIYFLAILMALQRRSRIFFRLYLIQAIIFFALGATLAIGLALSNIAGPLRVLTGLVLVLAISQFYMALNLGEDFTFDRKRILLRPDKDVKDATAFMRRANQYAKQKMWALAAVHFRRASLLYPHNIDPLLSLTVCFINLDSYDNAAEYLTRAMELDPTHRRVAKLTALLTEQQTTYYAQQKNRVLPPTSLGATP